MAPSLRVLIAGALFATGGALIKSCAFPSLERAGLRAGIAALTLFVLLPQARRWPSRRVLALVPAYFAATCLFVVANTLTTAANAIFLQSTAPLWIVVASPLLLREKPAARDLRTLAWVAIGMTVCFLAPMRLQATAPDPQLGDWIALGSGVGYAALLLGMRWLGRDGGDEACAAVAWGNALTMPIAFALMPVFGQQPTWGGAGDWAAVLVLGVFQVGLAYALLVRSMAQVSAVQASLLLMIEPALNPLLAFAVHGERPHWLGWLGGALIVGAVALRSVRRSATAARSAA
ncbi:MAG: DMT family transporter [Planctomycetes bacterium]|nr:DMT family transporter [Planctomycetota bacterium]MCB9884745.1 DMT family transporter [Planctomycetota bacterium]